MSIILTEESMDSHEYDEILLEAFKDKNLSFAAKGIFSYMIFLSKIEELDDDENNMLFHKSIELNPSIKKMAEISTNGKDYIRNALNLLMENRYIKHELYHNSKGFFLHQYIILNKELI